MDYESAMQQLSGVFGTMIEMPDVKAKMHHPQVPEALHAYVNACVAMSKADIAFTPVFDAFLDHSKWHENQDWTEFRTLKHAVETANETLEEAHLALMESINVDFIR